MGLSCDCDFDFDPSDCDEWFYWPSDYTEMAPSRARKRCCSCKELIDHNATVTRIEWCRHPTGFEHERLGWDEPIINRLEWMCEKCSDIYFSLAELGFCMDSLRMQEHLAEYHEFYGKRPLKEEPDAPQSA